MNWKHLIWIIPILLIAGFVLGSYSVSKMVGYADIVRLCHERGYDTPALFERGNFNGTEVFSIFCVNYDGDYAIIETFDVYDEVFNKPLN